MFLCLCRQMHSLILLTDCEALKHKDYDLPFSVTLVPISAMNIINAE